MAKDGPNPWDRVSLDYDGQIISPLLHAQKNPLLARLKKLAGLRTVLDLGCGTGNLLPQLTQYFPKVTALDGSSGMIEQAKQKFQGQKNVPEYVLGSIENLAALKRKWDIIIAVNSLITTDFAALEKSFAALSSSLAPDGHLFVIVPSMESIWEEFRFTYQQELARYKGKAGKAMAKTKTRKKLDGHRIDWELGEYHTDDMSQKYYTWAELQNLLEKNNLKIKKQDRVLYQSGPSFNYHDERAVGQGPQMWDHYVEAKHY